MQEVTFFKYHPGEKPALSCSTLEKIKIEFYVSKIPQKKNL